MRTGLQPTKDPTAKAKEMNSLQQPSRQNDEGVGDWTIVGERRKKGRPSDKDLSRAPNPKGVRHANENRLSRIDQALKRVATGRRHGNTEALVIAPFDSSCGMTRRILTLDDGLVHETLQQQITENTVLLEVDDYTQNNRATCKPAHAALASYSGYKVLFGERMYARNYPTRPTAVKFMDLPGEIRNRIYRLFLVVEPEIDFCPRSSESGNSLVKHTKGRLLKLKPILRLLRLNRDINKEASDIFYGENEFRFTYTVGWMFLLAFLRKIGSDNVSRLRRLSVPAPYTETEYTNMSIYASSGIRGTTKTISEDLYRMGLQIDLNETPSFEASIRGCVKILERGGKLKLLRLLLPMDFEFADGCVKPFKLDRSKFDNLAIMLVHLRRTCSDKELDSSQTPTREVTKLPGDEWEMVEHVTPEALAAANDWEYADVEYNKQGRYPTHEHISGSRYGPRAYQATSGKECACESAVAVLKWYAKVVVR